MFVWPMAGIVYVIIAMNGHPELLNILNCYLLFVLYDRESIVPSSIYDRPTICSGCSAYVALPVIFYTVDRD